MRPTDYSAPSAGPYCPVQAQPQTATQKLERVLNSVRDVENVIKTARQDATSKK